MDNMRTGEYGGHMGKVDYRTLPKEKREEIERELFLTLKQLGLKAEGTAFMQDMLTQSEIVMLGRRIQIARRLLSGKNMPDIAAELHVSFNTIHTVDLWLEEKFAAYRRVLPPLLQNQREGHEKRKGRSRIPLDPNSFRGLRKRYPAHAVLLNCLLGDPEMYEED